MFVYSLTNAQFICPGPPVPAGVQVSLTLERTMGLAVYWEAVRGASLYFALSSMGQNCTTMGDPFCIISPIGCSENHTLIVMAENQAGPSSPSHPQDQLTCMHKNIEYIKHTKLHLHILNTKKKSYCPPLLCTNLAG